LALPYYSQCVVFASPPSAVFIVFRGLDAELKCNDLLTKFHGLSAEEQLTRLYIYGHNTIIVEVKSYFRLFFEEVFRALLTSI